MFGKVEALVEKYPVFFTLGLLISSILRGKTLDALRREDQPSWKKVWFFCVLPFALLLQFYLFLTEEGFILSYIQQRTNEFGPEAKRIQQISHALLFKLKDIKLLQEVKHRQKDKKEKN